MRRPKLLPGKWGVIRFVSLLSVSGTRAIGSTTSTTSTIGSTSVSAQNLCQLQMVQIEFGVHSNAIANSVVSGGIQGSVYATASARDLVYPDPGTPSTVTLVSASAVGDASSTFYSGGQTRLDLCFLPCLQFRIGYDA